MTSHSGSSPCAQVVPERSRRSRDWAIPVCAARCGFPDIVSICAGAFAAEPLRDCANAAVPKKTPSTTEKRIFIGFLSPNCKDNIAESKCDTKSDPCKSRFARTAASHVQSVSHCGARTGLNYAVIPRRGNPHEPNLEGLGAEVCLRDWQCGKLVETEDGANHPICCVQPTAAHGIDAEETS